LIITIIIHNLSRIDAEGKEKELNRILMQRKEADIKRMAIDIKEYTHDGDDSTKLLNIQKDNNFTQNKDTNKAIFPEEGDFRIQTGSYDSEGRLIIGNTNESNEDPIIYYTAGEIEEFKKGTCKKPTEDNPFMNPTFTDFNNGDPPAACNVDDDQINDEMKVNFNHQLFRDVDEIWEKENSQRNFYTMPNTAVPNNQKEFAMWLYGGSNRYPDCKTDGNCLRYEDLRWKRDNFKR